TDDRPTRGAQGCADEPWPLGVTRRTAPRVWRPTSRRPGSSRQSSGARPSEKHIRVEDAVRIQGPFDGTEGGDLGLRPGEMHPALLCRADPVLGADAPAPFGYEPQSAVAAAVVVRRRAHHVAVDAAVRDVSEQER